MRTYRCVSQQCDEAFALERARDAPLPNRVLCPFCGQDASVTTISPDGRAVDRRIGHQYGGAVPSTRFTRFIRP